MGNFKRRRRTDQRRASYGRKTFLCRGIQRRDWRDSVPSANVRQRLKRAIWEGW